ncbi:MAG: hypothetical protein QNJ31_02230 [Candidatus Caenarcaniphilales bacterium]|nr:hypothetical protein [Candidatus Caenarcaniphilales bacterium]
MICSLDILKKTNKINCQVKILESDDVDLQLYLDRLGISAEKVLVDSGPWGSYIIKCKNQEIAVGPMLANKLKVETV